MKEAQEDSLLALEVGYCLYGDTTQRRAAPSSPHSLPSRSRELGGYIVPPKDYFPELTHILKVRWVLFVDDEVQMGFMRTGRLFAIERLGASQKRLVLLDDCYHLITVDKKKREVADQTVSFLEELIQSKVIC